MVLAAKVLTQTPHKRKFILAAPMQVIGFALQGRGQGTRRGSQGSASALHMAVGRVAPTLFKHTSSRKHSPARCAFSLMAGFGLRRSVCGTSKYTNCDAARGTRGTFVVGGNSGEGERTGCIVHAAAEGRKPAITWRTCVMRPRCSSHIATSNNNCRSISFSPSARIDDSVGGPSTARRPVAEPCAAPRPFAPCGGGC